MATTHTVIKGDTLRSIAQKYLGDGTKYKQLAAINNISNPDRIYIGQVIKLTNDGGGSSGSSSTSNSSRVVINQFGLQSNTDNTLFATWSWDRSYTDSYQVMWYYDTGDNHWFVGNDSTVKYKEATYSIPSNARAILFRVKPISQKHKVGDQETSYWTASWSTDKIYNVNVNAPKTPPAPNVEIDKFKLTAELDNLDINAFSNTVIEFQVVKDNNKIFKTGKSLISTNHASYSCTVAAGSEYKVRCRAITGSDKSEWSAYSSNVGTIPATPKNIIRIKALSATSVQLKFDKVANSTGSIIEYTKKIMYFDSSSEVQSITVNSTEWAEITGLESGSEYFFRVKAKNDQGESGWSAIKSIVIGKPPTAPTTWASSTTVISGEPLYLYWTHNAEDGSKQTLAQIDLTTAGFSSTFNPTIPSSGDDEEEKPYCYSISTEQYPSGSEIKWRVRTAGITKEYGPWSIKRVSTIYAPPTLELGVTDINGNAIETLASFPFYISGLAGPKTQEPIGYYVTITANSAYECVDQIGNKKVINKGDQVYSRYFDTSDALLIEMSANNVDLENNVSYTITCTASMNSGLTAESSSNFTVSWTDIKYEPNAEISFDGESFVTHIKPYCEENTIIYYKVSKNNNIYTKTINEISNVWGKIIDGVLTTTGEQVYSGTTGDGEEVYYCIYEENKLVDDILLSVYRREFDGSFTELATGLDNSKGTFITDPHPALDYARYRVVATTKSTGAISYYDVPGYYIGVKSVIIQWNEEWTDFDTYTEDSSEQKPWSGSLLELPYNIDVSDSHDPDISLVEYIGRKHPVAYYGTQLGETSSWSVEIPKNDVNTLYALRRLAIWMGDVYVREPSGSGYWANIKVSFSQTHCELTIPVTLDITRVEGGV